MCAKKDSNMVCIINTYYIAAMLKSQYSYITTQVMPAYDDTVPSIDKITITKQGEEPIIIEAMPVISEDEIVKGFNTHRFTQPVKVELDATNGETLIYGMYGLTASEAVWYGMEESDYALTGLDNPTLVVDMQVVRQHYTLTLGLPVVDEVINEDGTTSSTIKGYYGTFSELPDVLYIFSPSSIPWLNIDYEAVMSRLFLLPAIYSVSNVYVEAGDYDLDMAIEGDATAHVFSVNGTPTPNEDNFKLLYQYLISAMADNLYTGGPIADGAEPVARISYKFRDSAYTDDVVEFYKTDDRKLIICLNGEPLYTCKENYVTRLVQNIESYYNNGSIIISW